MKPQRDRPDMTIPELDVDASLDELRNTWEQWMARVEARQDTLQRNGRQTGQDRALDEWLKATLAEFNRLNEEHRRRPLAERVPESVYLTDDEGKYAGLERSAPQR